MTTERDGRNERVNERSLEREANRFPSRDLDRERVWMGPEKVNEVTSLSVLRRKERPTCTESALWLGMGVLVKEDWKNRVRLASRLSSLSAEHSSSDPGCTNDCVKEIKC